MRKDDPVSFKELLVEIIIKTNEVPEEASSMKKWVDVFMTSDFL